MPREAKITLEQLREELKNDATRAEIAAKYHMDVANVSRAVKKLRATGGIPPAPNNGGAGIGNRTDRSDRSDPAGIRSGAVAANAPKPRKATAALPRNGKLPADGDSLSMWDTKAAADENFARLRELLDRNRYLADAKTRVRIHAEIRAHLELGVRVMETLYAIQEQAAFQSLVLDVLDEFDPSARERILDRLRERRALRKALSPNRGTLRPESH